MLDQVGSLSVLVLVKSGFSDPVSVKRMNVDMRPRGEKGAATEFRRGFLLQRFTQIFSTEERGGLI